MTRQLRKMKWFVMALVVGASLYSTNGFAFVVDPTGRYVDGGLGEARNRNDGSYIGCAIDSSYASCYAGDAAGHTGMCLYLIDGQPTAVLLALQSITSDSEVSFTWDFYGNCTSLYVNNASYNAPKKP